MRFPVQTSALFVLLGMLLSPPPHEGHASSPPADSVHFCLPAESGHAGQSVDADQRELDHPGPASKWAADLDVGEPRTVRLFYFLPNDRPYRTEVVDSMKAGILDLQSFFAEQMEAHEQGNTTFQIETDAQGDPVVHRVDGDYTDSHYSSRGYTEGEIERAYDNAANIILIVMDVSTRSAHGRGTGTKGSGWVMIYGEWNWFVAAHELGHTFGLHHDFRDNTYVMSYGRANRSSAQLSACAAEFLAVHPYFNPDVPLENESPPTIELISPTEYLAGSESVSVRLRVRNDEGLHQVILFVKTQNPFLGGTPEVKACRGLVGETDAIVEFDYDGITPSDKVGTAPEAHTSLSNTPRHKIYVVAVDTDGNRTSTFSPISFDLMETSPYDLATLSNGGEIFSVVFSPDGTTLAVGTSYNNVGLWDVATRAPIAALSGHTDNVYSVSFSPDGTTLASGSGDNTVKLWDVATRTNTATLSGHTDRVRSVSFSPDGAMVASGSFDGTVKLWDVTTRAHIATLSGHTDNVFSVSFSPDGTTLASGSNDRTVKLWDVATRNNTATLEHRSWAYSVDFSSDGTTLAATSGSRVELWDVPTKEKIATLYPRTYDESISSVSFSPDGAVLALGSGYKTVELWDVATKEKIVHFSGHTRGVYSVDFSPDGTILASSAWDGKVKLWDTSEWTAPIAPVSQRTSQVHESILGVVRLNDPNVSSFAEVTSSHLEGITALYLNDKGITTLESGDFDGLTSLEELRLWGNQLTSLPEDIFSGLSSLETLRFGLNQLTTLPSGLLEGLTSLTDLRMIGNRLTALPDGIFEGLAGLTRLALGGNAVDPLPISVALEKVGEGQFKAVTPTGAPFDIVLPLIVMNGTIDGGATTITIPAGRIESTPLTVTRTSGTTFAATVDIGTLPGLPANHSGYALVKSADLPVALTEGNIPAESVLTLTVGAGPGAALRGYNPHSLPVWNFGSLSSHAFVLDGVSYTLHKLVYNVAGKRLQFQTFPMLRGFELHLDTYVLRSFSARDYNLHLWENVNLNWIVGRSIRIRVVEATPAPPGPPTNLGATPGDKKVTLSWRPPANADSTTLPVTEYGFRVSDDGGSTWDPAWEIIPDSRSGNDNRTSYTVGNDDRNFRDGLVNGKTYTIEIRARGGDGPGAAVRATAVPEGATTAATDFNGDGRTDFVDFFLFADAYGGTDARFDLDGNGTVDFADFFKFVDAFGS